MALILGTVGPLGSGKTTLLRALSATPETAKPIASNTDVAFSTLNLAGTILTVVDAPGNPAYRASTMLSALAMDLALVCIASDEPLSDAARESLALVSVLPVMGVVVALTKFEGETELTTDLVNEIRSLASRETRIIRVSAQSGVGVDAIREELQAMARRTTIHADDAKLPWIVPIDRVFALKSGEEIASGLVNQGTLSPDAPALLLPGKHPVRIQEVRANSESVRTLKRGERAAIQVAGAPANSIHRGSVLTAINGAFETRRIHVDAKWVLTPKAGDRVQLYLGTESVTARFFTTEGETLHAQLRLEHSVAIYKDQPVIIRRLSDDVLLGGGPIQVRPLKDTSAPTIEVVRGNPERLIPELLTGQRDGLETDVICRSLGLTAPELGVTFENLLAKGQVLGFAGLWYAVPTFDALAQEFEAVLLQVHHEMPSQPTVPPEAVVRKAGLKWSGKPLDRILGHLSQTGRIERHGDGIRKPSFSTQLKPRQRALLTRVIECLSSEPVNTPHAHDIARLLGIPHPAVEEIMRIGIEIGEIIVLTEAVYYTPAQIQDLKSRLIELADGKPFSSNDMRDAFGTSRKYMLPILEYFDRIGFTERDGDRRTIVTER
jgi:selenocysteine-specific elongation factor